MWRSFCSWGNIVLLAVLQTFLRIFFMNINLTWCKADWWKWFMEWSRVRPARRSWVHRADNALSILYDRKFEETTSLVNWELSLAEREVGQGQWKQRLQNRKVERGLQKQFEEITEWQEHDGDRHKALFVKCIIFWTLMKTRTYSGRRREVSCDAGATADPWNVNILMTTEAGKDALLTDVKKSKTGNFQ